DLLERERELAAFDDALDQALGGEGRAILVRGDAGLGKTALLTQAVEAACERGFEVLRVRADSLEGELSFGACAQLFGDIAPAPGTVGEDRILSLIHGLYRLCAEITDRGPLLVCVDDAHWADVPSLRFMHFLARRLEGLEAVLVAGARPVGRG